MGQLPAGPRARDRSQCTILRERGRARLDLTRSVTGNQRLARYLTDRLIGILTRNLTGRLAGILTGNLTGRAPLLLVTVIESETAKMRARKNHCYHFLLCHRQY